MFKDFAEEKVVDDSASDEENSDVKWTQILKAPGQKSYDNHFLIIVKLTLSLNLSICLYL